MKEETMHLLNELDEQLDYVIKHAEELLANEKMNEDQKEAGHLGSSVTRNCARSWKNAG